MAQGGWLGRAGTVQIVALPICIIIFWICRCTFFQKFLIYHRCLKYRILSSLVFCTLSESKENHKSCRYPYFFINRHRPSLVVDKKSSVVYARGLRYDLVKTSLKNIKSCNVYFPPASPRLNTNSCVQQQNPHTLQRLKLGCLPVDSRRIWSRLEPSVLGCSVSGPSIVYL